jgi:hypothetical protein
VCIRVWLEGSWECADEFCGLVMRCAPAQDVDAADVIADAYPECIDSSSVDYSWEGLEFPQRRPRAQRAGFM